MKGEATYAGDPRHHHTDLTELRAQLERARATADAYRALAADALEALEGLAAEVTKLRASLALRLDAEGMREFLAAPPAG